MRNKIIILILVSLFFSCSFTPKKEKNLVKHKIPDKFVNISSKVKREEIAPIKWWSFFNSSGLNETVDSVIGNNLDLMLAAKRVEMLESQFDMARGSRYPAVTTSGGYNYQKSPNMMHEFNPAAGKTSISSSYNLRAGLRFEIDVWGKLRSREKAAVAELLSSKEDLQTVYLGIISQTVMIYFDVISLNEQIKLTEKSLKQYKTNYYIQKTRYEKGLGNRLNLELLRQVIENVKAKLSSEKQQHDSKKLQLSFLLGSYPGEKRAAVSEPFSKLVFKDIPVGIPSDILKNRSDILSAERKVDAAREMIGYAKADLFPSISLSAVLGYLNVSEWEKLFTKDHLTSSIGGEVNQTVFAGGSKFAAVEQKKIIYEQSVISYRKTVLQAFKEVEEALVTLERVKEQYEAINQSVKASERVLNETNKRFVNGLTPFYKVIDSMQSYFSSQSNLINMKKGVILSRIQLHKALGGNWLD